MIVNSLFLKCILYYHWGMETHTEINNTHYYSLYDFGTIILYPDGTTRFINNSWYDDINTDNLWRI